MSRLALAAAAVAFLALPAPALAQGYYGPFQPRTEDYGPGITVSGAGFAPLGHRDRAVARAVGDARRRAEAIAAELGVSVGEARAVELPLPLIRARRASTGTAVAARCSTPCPQSSRSRLSAAPRRMTTHAR